MTLTPVEAATVDGLRRGWPRGTVGGRRPAGGRECRLRLLQYLWVLSDELRDRHGDAAGDALGRLVGWGVTPYRNPSGRWQWWASEDFAARNRVLSGYGNYIPCVYSTICRNGHEDFDGMPDGTLYPTAAAAVEAFVRLDAGLPRD